MDILAGYYDKDPWELYKDRVRVLTDWASSPECKEDPSWESYSKFSIKHHVSPMAFRFFDHFMRFNQSLSQFDFKDFAQSWFEPWFPMPSMPEMEDCPTGYPSSSLHRAVVDWWMDTDVAIKPLCHRTIKAPLVKHGFVFRRISSGVVCFRKPVLKPCKKSCATCEHGSTLPHRGVIPVIWCSLNIRYGSLVTTCESYIAKKG